MAILALITGILPFSPLSPAYAANPAADIDQCANGGIGDADEQCVGGNWVNGNLGSSKAHYLEGQSVPYRLKFTDLATSGSHNVSIEWDTTKSGKHALDYLTTYDQTEADAAPCSGIAGCNAGSFTTWPIPGDGGMTAQPGWGTGATQVPGVFTLFGGTITGVSAYTFSGSWSGDSSTRITVTFTASVANPVLAWGGHIASRADWGIENSAVSISGSPYHMRLIDLDGAGGNQDRSLSNDAVIFPGSITVVKQAAPEGPTSFGFTATGGSIPTAFSLVDDWSASNTWVAGGITTFTTYTVTEVATPGWTLSSLGCTDPTGNTSTAGRTATIGLAEGDNVTCTYGNTRNASINVVKTASPGSLPEPGGPVTFNVAITNESPVSSVAITALSDDIYGDVATISGTSCTLPHTIAAAGTWLCSFPGTVVGDAGSTHTDIVTASGTDELGNPVSDSDDATVTITNVAPRIIVDKSASPTTVQEPGGSVEFTVTVTNPANAVEPIFLDSLVDNVYGDLDGVGTCDVSRAVPLAPGASYSCSFTETVSGDDGSVHTDVVTGTAHDNEENEVSDTGTASVTVTDVLPVINVDKTAGAAVVLTGQPVTYTYRVTNPGVESLSGVTVTDDKCAPVTRTGGDTDGDNLLEVDETWIYSCTVPLMVSTLNTATATGHDNEGNTATAKDTAQVEVRILHPAMSIVKTATPESISVSGSVTYTYVVTNTGDTPLFNVFVADDILGTIGSVGQLAVGESVTFAKTVDVNASTPPRNIGTVVGTDQLGQTVSASDDAVITVVLGAVLAQPELPRTGAPLEAQTRAALALIQVGVIVTLAGRRRTVARRAD